MSWVREDDRETLDVKIGRLSGDEYRELHVLRQYIGREHAGAGGIFSEEELSSMVYPTPRGARSVSAATFRKLLDLDLVRTVSSYSEAELVELETETKTNRRVALGEAVASIREAQEDGRTLYRCNRWEHYNGATDRTATERKARQRARLRGDLDLESRVPSRVPSRVDIPVPVRVPSRVSHGTVTASAYAHPVPSLKPDTPTSTVDAPAATQAGEVLETASELMAVRLLSAMGGAEGTTADYVRGAVKRLPESVIAGILELVPTARDKRGYVLGALKRELSAT